MYTIRPFQPTPAEYAATVAIYNTVWPDERPLTVAMCQESDQEWPPTAFHQHFVVAEEGAIIADGSCYEAWWQQQPAVIHLNFLTHPAQRGRGLDEQMYNVLLAAVQKDCPQATTLAAETREGVGARLITDNWRLYSYGRHA